MTFAACPVLVREQHDGDVQSVMSGKLEVDDAVTPLDRPLLLLVQLRSPPARIQNVKHLGSNLLIKSETCRTKLTIR